MPHESQLHLPFNLLTKSLLGSLEQTPEGGNLSKTALIALFALHLEEEMSQLQELQVVEKDDGYELGAYGDAGDLIPVSDGARPVQYDCPAIGTPSLYSLSSKADSSLSKTPGTATTIRESFCSTRCLICSGQPALGHNQLGELVAQIQTQRFDSRWHPLLLLG